MATQMADNWTDERQVYTVDRGLSAGQWLNLSEEVSLGFGDARYFHKQLIGSDGSRSWVFVFALASNFAPAFLTITDREAATKILQESDSVNVTVCSMTCEFARNLGLDAILPVDSKGYHLLPELIHLIEAGLFHEMSGRAQGIYQAAKGMELLCETLRFRNEKALIPLGGRDQLSMHDCARIIAARNMIYESFKEKLTLEEIGRACGINRAKLTSGFREMFDCSVAESILERRMDYASKQLTGSQSPISSIGYEAGYLNNASFARAFSRWFGRSPSLFRAEARQRASFANPLLTAA